LGKGEAPPASDCDCGVTDSKTHPIRYDIRAVHTSNWKVAYQRFGLLFLCYWFLGVILFIDRYSYFNFLSCLFWVMSYQALIGFG